MSAETTTTAERPRQLLATLHAVGRACARLAEPNEILRVLHHELHQVIDTTIFILGLYDEASETVQVVGQVIAGKELPGGTFPLGSGFTSHAIRTGKSQLIRRWSESGPRVQLQYATDQPGLPESGLTVPLIFDERVVGVLLVQSYRPEAYDDDDLMLCEAIAGQVATTIATMHRSVGLNGQLRRRVEELETILAGMTDALLIVDAGGRIARLNNAARVLLCLDNVSIVLGQPLDEERWGLWPLGARELAEALGPMIEALRRGETLTDYEIEFRAGLRRVLSFSCAPLREPGGALAGGVIVFRDVTQRRTLERLKDEILSIASHDLRTPLTTIRGHAQLLHKRVVNGQASQPELSKGLTSVVRQADRVIDLLRLLLDLSRVEAGRLELHRSRTDFVALVRNIVEGIQTTSDHHNLTVLAPPRLEGNWDEQRLEQVVHNLVANAVKYSPAGGTIEVVIEVDSEWVSVGVRDEGIGLAPDELARVFERFYRAEGTRRLEGTGLGLYICQAIVATHGGRIWAESAGIGRGSCFCFQLPLSLPAVPTKLLDEVSE